MAAMSMHSHNYCLQAPLKTLNRGNHFLRPSRGSVSGKRKSAVELLQETKCLYVKSETVLDHKQQLSARVPSSPDIVQSSIVKHVRGTPCLPKSPKLVAQAPRRSFNSCNSSTDQLQAKLRKLLNADSKENLKEDGLREESMKSPRWYRRCNSQGQDKLQGQNQSCPVHHKSLPDLNCSISSNSDTSEEAGCRYVLYSDRKSPPRQSTGACSAASSPRRSHFSSTHSNESSRSESDHVMPASPIKSSYGGSAGNAGQRHPDNMWDSIDAEGEDGIRLRPILRSKSDVCRRHTKLALSPSPVAPADLETFFEHLGLDTVEYNKLTGSDSKTSSPVFFSDTSSVDSQTLCSANQSTGGSDGATNTVTELPSIVERNARIIKWLCNCRKAQLSAVSDSNS